MYDENVARREDALARREDITLQEVLLAEAELQTLVLEYVELKAKIDELTAEHKDVKSELLDMVQRSKFEFIMVEGVTGRFSRHKVSLVTRKGSKKWNEKKLAQYLTVEELDDCYEIGADSQYVKVTEEMTTW